MEALSAKNEALAVDSALSSRRDRLAESLRASLRTAPADWSFKGEQRVAATSLTERPRAKTAGGRTTSTAANVRSPETPCQKGEASAVLHETPPQPGVVPLEKPL